MIVQIYEISNPGEAKNLVGAGVDHIGVLVGKGKYPHELGLDEAKKIFEVLPKGIKGVALTLAWNIDEISEVVKKTGPDIIHIGTLLENFFPKDAGKLQARFPRLKIMRSIPVINEESIEAAKAYEGIVDYLLLDTHKKEDTQIGATGQTHDWKISRKIVESVKTPVILAGGLGPDNVAEAIRKVKPAGVDSKTKTDNSDGSGKDLEKVKAFVKAAKSA